MKNNLQVLLNAHESSAEILIYAPISNFFEEDISAKEVAENLNLLKNVSNITVRINSPGGDVSDGLAIYNSLLNHPAKINVEIDGWALSVASVIAMAGDTITMAESSLFMIHNPWTIIAGDAEDLRKGAEVIDKNKEMLLKAYKHHTNLSITALSQAMDAETWYTPEEAKESGFVTDISKAQKVSAKFDLDRYRFKNAPITTGEDIGGGINSCKLRFKASSELPGTFPGETALSDDTGETKVEFNRSEMLLKRIELAEMAV